MPTAVEDTLVFALHRASQVFEAELAEHLAGLDLPPRRAVMLMAVGEAGNANQTALVAKTRIDRSTLADVLRRLEKLGLVRRHARGSTRAPASSRSLRRTTASNERRGKSWRRQRARAAPARQEPAGAQRCPEGAGYDAGCVAKTT